MDWLIRAPASTVNDANDFPKASGLAVFPWPAVVAVGGDGELVVATSGMPYWTPPRVYISVKNGPGSPKMNPDRAENPSTN
jgi:hypothetical protein